MMVGRGGYGRWRADGAGRLDESHRCIVLVGCLFFMIPYYVSETSL